MYPCLKPTHGLTLLLTCSIVLSGCTSAINAVTSQPIHPRPSTTSIGTDVDDWQMDTLIGVNIKKASPQLASSHINVTAYNKVVLLTGEVGSNELRALAGDTARNYRGVRQVYNELKIQGSSSQLSRANDSWLTTKIKSKLLAYKDINAVDVKVVTEGGVIYLMGLITRAQADKITNVASNTRGAIKVVRVFEYID